MNGTARQSGRGVETGTGGPVPFEGAGLSSLRPNPDWASLPLFDRTGWTRMPFGEFAQSVNERVEPADAADERYVGLEHIDPQNLHIHRWGKGSDVIGTKLRFQTGDIIFGRRRAYQRKLAVAEFDGICSAHALVVRAKPELVLPEFLPFLMMSDRFMNRAVEISVGSLSPTINWKTLKLEEFDLPPIEVQRRIAELLWAVDDVACFQSAMGKAISRLLSSFRSRLRADDADIKKIHHIEEWIPLTCWQVVTAKELVNAPITRGYTPTKAMNTKTSSIPFIKVYNLCFDGNFDFTKEPTFIEAAVHEGELRRSQTYPGDVLINLTGPPMGKISVVPNTYPAWNINQAIARFRIEDTLIRDYFVIYLQSNWAQKWFDMRAKRTSGQKNITLQLAQDLPVPLPPRTIMEHFVEKYHAIEEVQKRVRHQLQNSSRLIASICREIFP